MNWVNKIFKNTFFTKRLGTSSSDNDPTIPIQTEDWQYGFSGLDVQCLIRFTCSKSKTETLEKDVKYIQS